MFNAVITHIQVFGIGFSFGIAGPCFLFCTPILITYILGRKERTREVLADISVFLLGRLCAYILLGALAGLSGAIFRRATESALGHLLGPFGGVVSIVLGVFVLLNRDPGPCGCKSPAARIYGFGSLFTLGFIIGVSPCAPLVALLVEIALMARGAFDGALYAFSFGLGTLISGLLVIGVLAGILKGLAARTIKSKSGNTVFRVLCSSLLILFGLGIVYRSIMNR